MRTRREAGLGLQPLGLLLSRLDLYGYSLQEPYGAELAKFLGTTAIGDGPCSTRVLFGMEVRRARYGAQDCRQRTADLSFSQSVERVQSRLRVKL